MCGFEELIVLGTGNAMVTRCFNTCFALRNADEYLLVDTGGGNGILAYLDKAGIDAAAIHSIFITHAHTDHVLGFPWIVRKIGTLMQKNQYEGKLYIYGHDVALHAVRTICELTIQKKFLKLFDERIIFVELKDGDTADILGSNAQFFDIHSTKAKQFGVALSLAENKRLVCLGDEPCDAKCESIAQNADWLLCEAFCLYADRERFKPYEKHHSTAADAAKLASKLKVRNLVCWHTEDKTIERRKTDYSQEIAEHFNGNIFVPNDLERIKL